MTYQPTYEVYQLPAVPDPAGYKCYTVKVPDDQGHINAFFGALDTLARWNNWQRDAGHNARVAAYRWRQVLDALHAGDCPVPQVQFRQPDDCTLQASFDSGVTWATIYSATACVTDGINSAIASGLLGTPQQPPAGGTIAVNDCKTYHVTLNADNRWHCPIPVASGYTIVVSNVQGGWTDNPAHIWRCPNGQDYLLGACVGPTIPYDSGDPAPTIQHMRLIGNYNSAYVDAYDTTIIIPNGVSNADFFLQANDSNLTDNQGAITCDVQVCNYSVWCFHADFKIAKFGFYNDDFDTWSAGNGFALGNYGTYKAISLVLDIPAGANITDMQFCIEANHSYAGNWGGFYYNPSFHGLPGDYPVATACHTWTLGATGVTKIGTRPSTVDMSQVAYIVSATINGTGVNPFGSSNC